MSDTTYLDEGKDIFVAVRISALGEPYVRAFIGQQRSKRRVGITCTAKQLRSIVTKLDAEITQLEQLAKADS